MIKVRFHFWLGRLYKKQLVVMLGTPTHINLGDQAILLAAILFVRQHFPTRKVFDVPSEIIATPKCRKMLLHHIRKQDVIVGHGGGNMGDIYKFEEICRRQFIGDFPDNKIIIFPQTIHFTNTADGRSELKKSKVVYSKHKNLTLIAREKASYNLMCEAFPNTPILLTPDIVLSMQPLEHRVQRKGLLLCLRDDVEGALNDKTKEDIREFGASHYKQVNITDMMADPRYFFLRSKKAVIRLKLGEFQSAELVITDRLHGLIFAVLTGTPCIALANFNHKVVNTYKWVSYLPYIQFCDDLLKLEQIYKRVNTDKIYNYDPAHFDTYWRRISDLLELHGQ